MPSTKRKAFDSEVFGASTKKPKKEEIRTKEKNNESFCTICTIRTYIVGIRYHDGKESVTKGSKIWLRRNPHNIFDRNAVECWPKPTPCTRQQIVGHLCKELAAALAGLLDTKSINLQGKIVSDVEALSVAFFVLPILINLSGNILKREEIISILERHQYYDILTHKRTAPMKIRLVNGQEKLMAYEIEEIKNIEEKFDLQQMDLRHVLVLLTLLLEENHCLFLERDAWVKQLNVVNSDFELCKKEKAILRRRIQSRALKNYIVVKEQKVSFKSKQNLAEVIQFISTNKRYVDYFIKYASIQGLFKYCVTSNHDLSRTVFVLSGYQLHKLLKRINYDILSHPIIKDTSIHKMVSDALQIPRVILSWSQEGRKSFIKSIREGHEVIYHGRWMILGCAGVGKTTLLKKIRGLCMEEVLNTTPTEGVEIHNRIFEVAENSLQDVLEENISPVGITLKNIIKHKEHHSTPSSKEVSYQPEASQTNQKILYSRIASHQSTPKANDTILYSREERQPSIKTNLEEENTMSSHSYDEKKIKVDKDSLPSLLQYLPNKIRRKNKHTVDLLDFAGESEYYASHQIFLRPQAGYILVLNMAESLDDIPSKTTANSMMFKGWTNTDFLKYWMRSIHQNSPSAPVVLVATHAEGKTKRDIEEYFVEVWNRMENESLKGHFTEERKFAVTLYDDQNIDEIKECLAEESEILATWGQKIPRKWALCETILKDLKQSHKILSLSNLCSLLDAKLGEMQIEKRDLIWMLNFFHNIGNILYFTEKDLNNFVVLDVDFFIDLFKCIIKNDIEFRGKIARLFGKKWKRYIENGLLDEELCLEILKEVHDLKDGDKTILFQYMVHIGLITDSTLKKKTWYVPSMNKSTFPSKKFENYKRSSVYCFFAEFLPDILYHRLVSNLITGHSLGKILSDGDKKCFYQTVCAFYHHGATHIVLIGRCETSIQVQVLAKTDLDKAVSREILEIVSKAVVDLKTIFHLNIEFSEGLLCERSIMTDQFITSGICKEHLLTACETEGGEFLCKNCPVDQSHVVNAKELLSYWIDVDEIMKDAHEEMNKKREIYLKFYLVAREIKKPFEARELCFKLHDDDSVMESDGIQNLERGLFEELVKWMEKCPDNTHIKDLKEGLQEIGRKDIAEKVKHFELIDFVNYPVNSPQRGIRSKDVKIIVKYAAADYHKMGIFLGLSPQQLRNIDMNHPKCVQTKMQQALKLRTASRQELVNSLRFVGRVDVVKRLTTLWNES